MNGRPSTPGIETRALGLADMRVNRAQGQAPTIVGYAVVFSSLSEDLGGFREQILPGAFSDVLGNDVRALINHDPNLVLGRTTAGTLKLNEDAKGLLSEIQLPDTQAARDLAVSVERGDVSQMSFSFTVGREGEAWARDGSGPWIRSIKKVSRLYDVTVATFPAYPSTEAALRSLEAVKAQQCSGWQSAARARALKLRRIAVRC